MGYWKAQSNGPVLMFDKNTDRKSLLYFVKNRQGNRQSKYNGTVAYFRKATPFCCKALDSFTKKKCSFVLVLGKV